MKSLFAYSLFFFQCVLACCQDTSLHAIYWKPQMLSYSDFRGPVDYTDPRVGARTIAMLLIQTADTLAGSTRDSLAISVTSVFYPERSFFKSKNIGRKDVLIHEQLHFDIVEWYARLFRQQVSEAHLHINNYRRKIRKIVRSAFADLRTSQAAYDEQTRHGLSKQDQQDWNQQVFDQLQRLSTYKDTLLVIKLIH